MLVEFAGQSASDPDNGWANTARLLNCYREPVGDGNHVLKCVPGVNQFGDIKPGFSRASAEVDGLLYLVQNGFLWRVESNGNAGTLGAIPDSENTTISGNNGAVTIAAGGRYFVYENSTLTEPALGAFSHAEDVTFFGQLTVIIENRRQVQWSDVADPTSFPGLNFATTESRDDNNLRVLPVGSSLWFFKERSIERWQQNGGAIEAIPGSTIETGLKGRNLLTPTPNGCFFVGNDNKAYVVQGGGLRPVSTVAVETSIAQETPISCEYYQDEGHEVCVITYQNRPAWCFDISTGEWHERPDFFIRNSCQAYGNFFVGRDAAGLYRVERNFDTFTFGDTIICTAVGRTVEAGGDWFTVAKMHLHASVGTIQRDNTPPIETEAKLALRVSKDKGQTFGPRRERSLGQIGQYDRQMVWRTLGRMKQFTPEISWSEPGEVTISSKCNLEIT